MSAIDFIQSDIKRSRPTFKLMIAASAVLSILCAGIGLGARADFIDAFEILNLWPAFLILVGIAIFPWIYISQKINNNIKVALLTGLLALMMVVSLSQPQTENSLAKFRPYLSFWPETFHCLALGLLSSLFASFILTVLIFRFLPLPNKKWQVICAVVSGVCGLATLTFHCMGPLWSHIIIAHWGQAVLIFPVAYFQQRFFFSVRIKNSLGQISEIKNIAKIGD